MRQDKRGICPLCGNEEYSDIYQHRLTQKHKRREKGEPEPKPIPTDRTGVCEICGNRRYADIYQHRMGVRHNKLVALQSKS